MCATNFHIKNRQVREREREREVIAFMHVEKTYDRVDRNAMWKMLWICVIQGRLVEAI